VEQANGCQPNSAGRSKGEVAEEKQADVGERTDGARFAVVDPAAPVKPRSQVVARADRPGDRGVDRSAVDRSAPRDQTLLDWLGHELRNPIAAIELAVKSMRGLDDERLDQPLSILERQSRQLSRVVLELLEIARAISQRPAIALPSRQLVPREERDPGARPPLRERPLPGNAGGPARRLLLVEDNEDLAALLREMLIGWGFEVVAAGNARAALARAAASAPDVALIDIGLPDRDGCEVARALRRSLAAKVRLIAMSGYGQRQDGARALAAGFDEFMVKPLNTERLRRLLCDAGGLALVDREP
jgi:CheY-like chemotaxis protein